MKRWRNTLCVLLLCQAGWTKSFAIETMRVIEAEQMPMFIPRQLNYATGLNIDLANLAPAPKINMDAPLSSRQIAVPVDPTALKKKAVDLERKSIWTAYVANERDDRRENKLRTATEEIPLLKGSGMENLAGFQVHKPYKGQRAGVGARVADW